MIQRIAEWFRHRWLGVDSGMLKHYHACFSSASGQHVLQHFLDSIYCTVYEGSDPQEALIHNARRTVVHEILMNLDAAEHPMKYNPQVQTEEISDARGMVRSDS